MNIENAKKKLGLLTNSEVKTLLSLVQNELSKRSQYLSNIENTPREQSKALSEMFSQAWIHG